MLKMKISLVPEYTSYPKRFAAYKWFKPLLAILIAAIFIFVSGMVLVYSATGIAGAMGMDVSGVLGGGYDNLNIYSALGAIVTLASVAVMLPGVLIGNRIVNSRPFSSISSSRGGFDFKVFFKCICAALVLVVIPLIIYSFVSGSSIGAVKFTVMGFILCTILGPLQCVGEEYLMRGLVMQTFGSWIKFPIIAVLLQAIPFMLMHPYNITGMISVGITGAILGFIAYITHGLEAACALHIANNMTSFYMQGFGVNSISSTVTITDMAVSLGVVVLYLVFIIIADKKLGWFDHIRRDDAAEFNAKYEAKKAKKS